MFEKIIKYLSVITIGVFLLNYVYLYGYYSTFHVDIINYITTSEIFYVWLPFITTILSMGYAFFQGALRPLRDKQIINQPTNPKKKWYKSDWVLIILVVIVIVCEFINNKHFTYREAPAIQGIFSLTNYFCIGFLTLRREIEKYGVYLYLQIVFFIAGSYLIMQFGSNTAKITKLLGNTEKIQFKYSNTLYKTDDKLILLGETQSTIFLYNKKDSATLIIARTKIDSLIVFDK